MALKMRAATGALLPLYKKGGKRLAFRPEFAIGLRRRTYLQAFRLAMAFSALAWLS
jgi:hypothetical protein